MRQRATRLVVLCGLVAGIAACGGGGGSSSTPNSSPTASIAANPTSGKAPLAVTLDGSGSRDADGTIATYAWTYSDGAPGTSGVTTSRNFATAGTYTVTLRVTDNLGAFATATTTITVRANVAPAASFTATPTTGRVPLAVAFDASGSTDSDGSIATYHWDFGDGNTAAGVSASHNYNSAGNFLVTLRVTDDNGASDTETATVIVRANVPPTASFTAAPTSGRAPLAVSFDASASGDTDGSITAYQWSFGDGSTATGATASHTYGAPGTFTATLTVTDNDAAIATATRTIAVAPPVGGVRVTVRDTNGVPVAGAGVLVSVGGNDRSGTTDTNGVATVSEVLTGTGTVTVSRESFVTQQLPVTVSANSVASLDVVLARVTSASGGVVSTRVPQGGVSPDGRTLEFSIQVVVLDELTGEIKGLPPSAFRLLDCIPSADTADSDCVSGTPGFDAAYTVLGPGSDPSFVEVPGSPPGPFAAVLAFDQSGSIRFNDPTDARLFSAKEFLKSLGGSDVAAVAAFADGESAGALIPERPVTIYPVGAPSYVSDGPSLFDDLDSLSDEEGGGTPLYEAVCRLMDFSVAQAPQGVRQAVVLFTDGRDAPAGNTTGYQCRTLASAAAKSASTGVDIFSIGLSGDVDGAALATLAEAGRGVFLFAEDVTQLIPIYGSLGNLLSSSLSTYRLTFRIATTADDTFRTGRAVLGVLSVTTNSNPVNLPFVVRIF